MQIGPPTNPPAVLMWQMFKTAAVEGTRRAASCLPRPLLREMIELTPYLLFPVRRASKRERTFCPASAELFPPVTWRLYLSTSCLYIDPLAFIIWSLQPQTPTTSTVPSTPLRFHFFSVTMQQKAGDVLINMFESAQRKFKGH